MFENPNDDATLFACEYPLDMAFIRKDECVHKCNYVIVENSLMLIINSANW